MTLEGSQSPLAPFFVTLQTSEEQAGFEELVRWSVLENCHVVLCLLYNYDLSYNQAKDIFSTSWQMAFSHNPRHRVTQ